MKCSCCKVNFTEQHIHLSHDVPLYLFFIDFPKDRNSRKNAADKFGRRYLCVKCHEDYEQKLSAHLKLTAQEFAEYYFKVNEVGDDTNTDAA